MYESEIIEKIFRCLHGDDYEIACLGDRPRERREAAAERRELGGRQGWQNLVGRGSMSTQEEKFSIAIHIRLPKEYLLNERIKTVGFSL